jgi:ABC-type transport system involved in multi-copper enzyme maturation permease subunit
VTQMWAIFYDAYRSLNAKRMFWIVLLISGLVVAAFALVGINEKGLKIAFWQFKSETLNSQFISPAYLYKTIFVQIGIGVWLSWIAAILALVSTAGIFPDLVTSGSIALLVSKPIGRLRLFILQYAAGLLFVTLQVAIFSVASFLVIGFRGGVWEPGLFMAIPLVVCFFSYLFSVCVFLGIATRSTLAALLLTLLFWFVVYGVGTTENMLLMFRTMDEQGVTLEDMQQGPAAAKKPTGRSAQAAGKSAAEPEEEQEEGEQSSDVDEAKQPSRSLIIAHKIAYGVKTFLPKTSETVGLLERSLISLAELPQPPGQQTDEQAQLGRSLQETLRSRSVWWIVGTSLAFELFVLSWAAWIFCRRDF